MYIYNPLEQFEVQNYLSLSTPLGNLSITNSALYLFIATILSYLLVKIASKSENKLIGNNFIILIDGVEMIDYINRKFILRAHIII